MKLVYVLKRFPKVSETFVQGEIQELLAQGEEVTVCSLLRPHRGEPRHPGADDLASRTIYVPEGPARFPHLVGASIRALAVRPRLAWPALAWCLGWAIRDREVHHVKRFGEACWLLSRIPGHPDHLHAHFAHGATTVALLLGRLTARPFSFTGHARDIFQLVHPELLAAKLREARFAVAVSEHGRDHIRRAALPADRGKVAVVRNGVDQTRFGPRGSPPDGDPVVLVVARLVPKKGVDTLVEAANLLGARGIRFRIDVVGDGPLRPQLERRASDLQLDGRMRFRGALTHPQVREAYERATVFALACRRTAKGDQDGLPVAIVEAMSVGVPVVSTPVGGVPEVVTDGVSGLLVSPDDPEAMADAVCRLLGDSELRLRLVRGGLEVAAAFDRSSTVARVRSLFRTGTVA